MGQPALAIDNEPEQESGVESIWDRGTLERVKEFSDLVADVKDSRSALNAKLAAGKTGLIDMGFNKDALEAAIKYSNTPEEKRENFDLSYLFCRKALGHPVQDDLFAAAMQQQVKVTTAAKPETD